MNHPLLLRIFVIANVILMLSCLYVFLLLTGKYYLKSGDFKKSETIFSFMDNTTGKLISLIENGKFDKDEKYTRKGDLFAGIVSWAKGGYTEALSRFEKAGYSRELAYTYLKLSEVSKAKALAEQVKDPTLTCYLHLKEGNYAHAADYFLKSNNYIGLSSLFIQLDNLPTAVFYLITSGHPLATMIGQLLQNKELAASGSDSGSGEIPEGDLKFWIHLLRGDLASQKISTEQHPFLPLVHYLNGNLDACFETNLPSTALFLQSMNPAQPESNTATLLDQLVQGNPALTVYSLLPETIEVQNRGGLPPYIWGIGLGIVGLVFSISLFYLYRKYSATLVVQRQKDLEKMDALSIVKSKDLEAKKKRDKTELNVSSFVTMNIQLEVLDAAFTKLGLRVDPNKLGEQIEKTKIPNISFKIYTISNSYGLGVKMLSVQPQELLKQKAQGAVVLVLKGDLIALLKNADEQNVYLQFSQKDSRKVPYATLKISWDGNIIQLNRV